MLALTQGPGDVLRLLWNPQPDNPDAPLIELGTIRFERPRGRGGSHSLKLLIDAPSDLRFLRGNVDLGDQKIEEREAGATLRAVVFDQLQQERNSAILATLKDAVEGAPSSAAEARQLTAEEAADYVRRFKEANPDIDYGHPAYPYGAFGMPAPPILVPREQYDKAIENLKKAREATIINLPTPEGEGRPFDIEPPIDDSLDHLEDPDALGGPGYGGNLYPDE